LIFIHINFFIIWDNIEIDSESFELKLDLKRLCPDCNELWKKDGWCWECNVQWFQQDFSNWTSGNDLIDEFIQESQSNAY